MPRRNQRKSDPIEAVPFTTFSFQTATSTSDAAPTVQGVNIIPTLDTRLAAISDVYQWYRFTKIRVHLLPAKSGNDVLVSCGYIPRLPNTAPTDHNMLQQLPASAIKAYNQTVKSTMIVQKDIMIGDSPLKWFQTAVGTEADQFEIQGVVYFAGTATTNPGTYYYVIDGVCEFKGRSNSSQTPLFRQIPAVNKEGEDGPLCKFSKGKEDESGAVVIGGVTYYRSKA